MSKPEILITFFLVLGITALIFFWILILKWIVKKVRGKHHG